MSRTAVNPSSEGPPAGIRECSQFNFLMSGSPSAACDRAVDSPPQFRAATSASSSASEGRALARAGVWVCARLGSAFTSALAASSACATSTWPCCDARLKRGGAIVPFGVHIRLGPDGRAAMPESTPCRHRSPWRSRRHSRRAMLAPLHLCP